MEERRCKICGEQKLLKEFDKYRNGIKGINNPHGLKSKCIDCCKKNTNTNTNSSEYNKKYYIEKTKPKRIKLKLKENK